MRFLSHRLILKMLYKTTHHSKLDYIHNNPCSGKWNPADCHANYIHSSASFLLQRKQGIFTVDNIMELIDIDLSKKG